MWQAPWRISQYDYKGHYQFHDGDEYRIVSIQKTDSLGPVESQSMKFWLLSAGLYKQCTRTRLSHLFLWVYGKLRWVVLHSFSVSRLNYELNKALANTGMEAKYGYINGTLNRKRIATIMVLKHSKRSENRYYN